MKKEDVLISIIVPAYNVEATIERCLRSILSQTYTNLEIIVVDDGSKDKTNEIAKTFCKLDSRVKLIVHEKNRGLYRARLSGVKYSKGKYIGFVDSDDYISKDFYRELVVKAIENDADITFGRLVQEDENGYKWIQNIYEDYEFNINCDECIKNKYWAQEGQLFIWHTVWNKLYAKKLWEKALEDLEVQDQHIVMCEDFIFSSILFSYVEKISFSKYARYYYYRNTNASTALTNEPKKFEKNINDLIYSFHFIEKFLKEKKESDLIFDHFNRWEGLYKYFWTKNVMDSQLEEKDKAQLIAKINTELASNLIPKFPNYFYNSSTEYDDRYEKVIELIISENIKVVSFDIFDTALLRPFYQPTDLFVLLDSEFERLLPNMQVKFSKIRIMAECKARERLVYSNDGHLEDITLEDIYNEITKCIPISEKIINILKEKEIELEEKFLKKRESIYNIYQMAIALGKKVVFTSDMYLCKKNLKKILVKNGYTDFDEIFVSCELNASKRTGTMYSVMMNRLNVNADNVVHIGDNWDVDVINARKYGIYTCFYPSPISCINYEISDINTTHAICGYKGRNNSLINMEASLNWFGNKCAIALVADKLYDMPFYSYNKWSETNCSPQFLGYMALGMHLLGYTKWISDICEKKNYEKIAFVSRDGYLPMESYKIFCEKCNLKKRKIDYFFTSRKATLPCGIRKIEDFYSKYESFSTKHLDEITIIKYFEPLLDLSKYHQSDKFGEIKDYKTYCLFIDQILKNLFDEKKAEKFNDEVTEYFNNFFDGDTVLVDVGYSGRTQQIIYEMTGKKIDGLFVHKNEDECKLREEKYDFSIDSFYDFTPSITGAQREILFSSVKPSCIGYASKNSQILPKFEDYDYQYPKEYLLSEIHHSALEFVSDFCITFGKYIHLMNMRNLEISYPFEHVLAYLENEDLKMFECILFEDDMWAGETVSLSKKWLENINYHQLCPSYKRIVETKIEYVKEQPLSNEINYAWELYNQKGIAHKNIWKKAVFWLINDRKFFVERLSAYLRRK